MPLPEPPARAPDDNRYPAWVAGLQCEEPNHTVLVVRDLGPENALRLLGVPPDQIRPCELPAERPDKSTSLPRAAFGTQDAAGAVLLAGRMGDWTFIYDDGGITPLRARHGPHPAAVLSADGRESVTSTRTINAATDLAYAAGGELLCHYTDGGGGLDEAARSEEIPAGLRAAAAAAGVPGSGEPAQAGQGAAANMRVLCAKAGLLECTLDDLRQIPLLVAPLGVPGPDAQAGRSSPVK
jgi:hypothetical protein